MQYTAVRRDGPQQETDNAKRRSMNKTRMIEAITPNVKVRVKHAKTRTNIGRHIARNVK